MGSDKSVTKEKNAHISKANEQARTEAMDAFDRALKRNDYFSAAKAIGVLEFIGQPDTDYFSGMMYQGMANELMDSSMEAFYVAEEPRVKEYLDKAVDHLSKVPRDSEFYAASVEAIEAIYRTCGDYKQLDALLRSYDPALSPIEEMAKRVECLGSLAIIDPLDHTSCPSGIVTPPVKSIDQSANQQRAKYQVFSAFANALAVIAECVYQCAIYAQNAPRCDMRFAEHQETVDFTSLYDKCVFVLRCSDLIDKALMPEAMGDLLYLALSDSNWRQRIEKIDDKSWCDDLAKTCWQLCAPQVHPQVDAYQCVEGILQSYLILGRFDLSPIVSQYFDIIANAAKNGNQSARAYLGFTYSMIKVNGSDPCDLEKRLARSARDSGGEIGELVLKQVQLSTVLSRRSYDALVNAEFALMLHEGAQLAERDASHIALMCFRVLEYEYTDGLVRPFIAAIDFDRLEETTGYVEHSKRRALEPDEPIIASEYERWLRGLDALYAVKTGFKSAFEIGVLRTLLVHILQRNDACATLLRGYLEGVMTDDGREAFRSEKMMDVIGKTRVEEYRVPGAHTGFVTLTKAKEARLFVTMWAPKVATWFKAAEQGE